MAAMYEFESVSVSSFEAASLAATLTEKSADGWDVVAIVTAGSTSSPTSAAPRDSAAALGRRPTGRPPTATDTAAADRRASLPSGGRAADADVGQLRAVGLDRRHVLDDASGIGHRHRRHRLGRRQRHERRQRRPAPAGAAALGVLVAGAGRRSRRPTPTHALGPGRLVRRPGGSLRVALLGRHGVDRARVAGRPAVHRPARRLSDAARPAVPPTA